MNPEQTGLNQPEQTEATQISSEVCRACGSVVLPEATQVFVDMDSCSPSETENTQEASLPEIQQVLSANVGHSTHLGAQSAAPRLRKKAWQGDGTYISIQYY